jgi:hypothetical protein
VLSAALFSISICCSGILIGQTQGIQTLLEPERSNQVLAWENTSNQNVVRWRVDILKEETVNGQLVLTPQVQFFQNKSYLGVDKQYMTANHYYRIYGLDAADNIIVVDNGPLPAAPGVLVETGCEQKCSGSDFAFGITQYIIMSNGTQGASYLGDSQSFAWSDPATNTVTPYFHYISYATWDAYEQSQPYYNPYMAPGLKIIHFRISDIPSINFVKDAQGNGISDRVVGIEKRMGSISPYGCNTFEILSGKQTGNLASKLACNPQLADFTQQFNQYNELVYPSQTLSTVPTLACNVDENNFLMSNDGVIFTTDPTDHDHPGYTHVLNGWLWYPEGYWGDGTTGGNDDGTNKGVLSFEELNTHLEIKSNPTYSNGVVASDFIQFEFQVVGDPNSSIVVYPSDVTQEDGSLSFSNLGLPMGLFTMNVIHSDLTLYSVYFESLGVSGNKTEISNGEMDVWLIEFDFALSIENVVNKTDLKAYPNPTSTLLNFSLPMTVSHSEISLTNITGKVVYSEKLEMVEQSQIDVSNLPKGMYVLSVISEDFQYTRKVMIE